MVRLPLFCFLLFLFPLGHNSDKTSDEGGETIEYHSTDFTTVRMLYEELSLRGCVSIDAFEAAVQGYESIEPGKSLLTVIDFSKPSVQKRLAVIDMESKTVVYSTHVAHGKGSGDNYAMSFSNESGSHKSSLGFYLTGETYDGRNGYSMRLDGLEKGINDKARERAIVMHGADYCDPELIPSNGRLGRSFGCPAVPQEDADYIMDLIKEGSVLFIWAADNDYLSSSSFISDGKA